MRNPKEIGTSLKEARQKKSLSLEAAHKATRIQTTVLSALEEGRASETLPRIYLLLFLRKYAAFLNLDQDKIVADYKAANAKLDAQFLNIKRDPYTATGNLQIWIAPVVAITLVIIFAFFVLFLGIKVKALFRPRQPKEITTVTTAVKKETINKVKIFPISENKPIAIGLKSTSEVWMRAVSDDKIIFDGTLKNGETKELSSQNEIKLWLGRAEALNLTIDGKPIGVLGRGNLKNVYISRSGIKIGKKWLIKAE
ncbi:MAG: RodZ domain-containing protein [Candidatus Omnitrophota bacterium]